MATVLVVGGGVLGTMHAFAAHERGHTVTQLEADLEPRKASVRNFGLVWVSGRAPGAELHLALRARALWEQIAREVPGIGFRPDGSLTVAQQPAELAVLEAVAAAPEAAARELRMLEPAEVPGVNPAIRGSLLGALLCTRDAVVEPRRALPALRQSMADRGRYRFVGGRVAIVAEPGRVRDHTGYEWKADLTILCPGAAHTGVAASWLASAPLRRCRLQMMQTAPLGERLTTSVADGDSLRYYPAFDVPEAAALPAQAPVGAAWRAQLLISQRAGGELTIGDTHVYDEPYDFAVEDEPYEHLRTRAESILGASLPPVQRRWAGVYSQATDASVCVRVTPEPGLVIVTGPGGRGMTLSPALAAETFEGVGW
ncbi:MAG: TIGR03364 family FAD-dependent oxidoreductase [Acidimicrobiia bacterium]